MFLPVSITRVPLHIFFVSKKNLSKLHGSAGALSELQELQSCLPACLSACLDRSLMDKVVMRVMGRREGGVKLRKLQ